MPKLYDYVLSDGCYKVRLMLSLLGISYEVIAINAYPGREHEGAAFRAINPHGDLPVLEDGAETFREATTILLHLARRYGTGWLPSDPAWLAFAREEMASVSNARDIRLIAAPGDLEAAQKSARKSLRRLEDHLSDRGLAGAEWVIDDRPTIADIALFPHVALSHDAGIGLEDYPALDLWQRRVRRLDRFVGMPGIPDYF